MRIMGSVSIGTGMDGMRNFDEDPVMAILALAWAELETVYLAELGSRL
jgi:hypothetical protein